MLCISYIIVFQPGENFVYPVLLQHPTVVDEDKVVDTLESGKRDAVKVSLGVTKVPV